MYKKLFSKSNKSYMEWMKIQNKKQLMNKKI